MEEKRNWLVIELGGRYAALNIPDIDGIVESAKIFFLPGARHPVKGVIAHKGYAISVVDLGEFMGAPHAGNPPFTVVIMKERKRSVGLLVGEGRASFLWEEYSKKDEVLQVEAQFVSEAINHGSRRIELVNWGGIYDEAARVLAGGGH